MRAIDGGLLSFEVLDVGRALLRRRPALLDERLVASPGDAREVRVRLSLSDLRLGRRNLSVLSRDLRVDIVDAGFRPRDLGLRLGERGQVIALVDLGDHIALVDVLVVGDRNGGDVARDFGRDRELAGRDEGVIGRFEMRGMVPVDVGRRPGDEEGDQAGARHEGMPAEEALARFFGRLFVFRGGLFLFRGRLLAGFALFFGRLRRALGLLGRVRWAVGVSTGRSAAGDSSAGGVWAGGARKEIMSRLGLAEPPERGGETLSQSTSDAGASLYIFWPLS